MSCDALWASILHMVEAGVSQLVGPSQGVSGRSLYLEELDAFLHDCRAFVGSEVDLAWATQDISVELGKHQLKVGDRALGVCADRVNDIVNLVVYRCVYHIKY